MKPELIKGIKGLHEICKSRAAGLGMPDETSVGDNIQVILTVNANTSKKDLRNALHALEADTFTNAKIIAHKDLV